MTKPIATTTRKASQTAPSARRSSRSKSAAALRPHFREAGGAGSSGGSAAASCCMLGLLQHLDDAERARTAGERLGGAEYALDEVLGGERERLGGGGHFEPARCEVAYRD